MRVGFQRILAILFLLLSFLFFFFDLSWGRVPVKKVFPGWTSYTSSSCIKDLVLDRGILWAAAGGVIEYNLEKGTRVKYLKEHGIASNNVLKIVLHDHTLWAATANGISCLHLEKNTWKSFYKTDGLPDDAVTAAAVDAANHRIWFGTWEGYLFSFSTIKKKWDFYQSQLSIPDTIISSLAVDPANGTLLVGTWGKGLYTYKPGSQTLVKPKFSPHRSIDFISTILVEGSTLWIRTSGSGVWVTDLRTVGTDPESINRKFLRGVQGGSFFKKRPPGLLNVSASDAETIYSGSDGQGILRLNLKTGKIDRFDSANLSNEIAHNKVSEVTPDPGNNRLWIGTEGNGAAFFDLVSERWTILNSANRVLPSDVVNCIAVNGLNDSVWIGTDNGIVCYRANANTYRRYGFEEGLDSVMIYAAGFDHLDRLWAAFYIGSPARFDPRSERWRTDETAPAVICHALSIDKKGQSLWMATAQGIVDYNMKTQKNTGYWTGSEFRSLWFDAEKKEIWAGSWGEGLFHLEVETGQKQKIKRFENLSVLDIKKDEEKNTIWFATNAGAFYYDTEKQTFKHLDVTNGLGLNYVLSIGITRDSIWFGTWDGGLSRLGKNFASGGQGGAF